MKLSEWERQQGISDRTAWRWFTAGTLPVPAKHTATGAILVVSAAEALSSAAALDARVSSSD